MKKTLLILCALLLTSIGASAQITDVTEQYIQNPSFEEDAPTGDFTDSGRGAYTITSLTDWTLVAPENTGTPTRAVADLMTEGATATDDNIGAPGAPSNGTYMLYLRNAWIGNEASVTQKVTLPAGDYMLTVDNKCFTTATSITSGEKVILKAGEKEVELSITQVTANSDATPSVVPEEWSVGIVEFSIDTDDTELELGVEINFQNAAGLSVLLDNFKLYSVNYAYNITKLLANPSFEDDDVSDLTVDSNRGYAITELTGWTLNGPDGGNAHKDIMTSSSTETDNNYGIPGDPSDGTQMLYLRDAWGTNTGSVMQSLVLPAGEYKVTVDAKCAAGDPTQHSASLVVGEESTALTIHAKGTPTEETAEEPFAEEWDTAELEFILTETTEVSLGVQLTFGAQQYGLAVILDNFQLFSTEEVQAIDFDYDVTWELVNPSFEVDKVAYLTEDATRSTSEAGDYTGGAYTIGNGLTGWTLGGSNAVSDLMTEACQRTDNNFGAPGAPADGTQMFYLRNNATTTGSVKQTITLPAGDYMLTVDTKCVSTSNSTAKLVAGEKSVALTIHTESSIPSAWDTAELVLSLEAETEVTLGVDISYSGNGSFLLDNFKLYSVEAIEESITWTMTDAGWGTMILPFDAASIPDGLTLYADDAITVSDSELTVDEEKAAASIAANTPYLVKSNVEAEEIPTEGIPYAFTGTPTNTADTYTVGVLTGTLVDLAVAKGAAFATDGTQYLLQNQEEVDGVAFYPIVATESADATLDAYHCYLTIESEEGEASPTKLSIVLPGSGETTAIKAVEGDVIANSTIYDLSGRRVAKTVKGVYIQNGKKVLVK